MEKSTEPATDPLAGTQAGHLIRGSVERFDGQALIGWASDGTNEVLKLDIFIDNEFFRSVQADLPRQDVIDAGFAITNSGFVVNIPQEQLKSGRVLRVYDNKHGREMPGSPCEISHGADDAQSAPPMAEDSGEVRKLLGRVERFDGQALIGWASNGTNASPKLDIFIDNDFFRTVQADEPRQDVVDAGFAATNSGFAVNIPLERLGGTHVLRVFDSRDGRELPGSPYEMTLPTAGDWEPPPGATDSGEVRNLHGRVERFDGYALSGWASDGTDTSPEIDIFIDDDLYSTVRADLPRQDVIDAGFAITNSGFVADIPRAQLNGRRVLRVYDHVSGTELPASPLEIVLPTAGDWAAEPTAGAPDRERIQQQPLADPARDARNVHGHVEGFDGRTVSGWVTDGGPDHTSIKIFLNEEFYAEIEGDLPRKDVVDAGFTKLNSGFLFDVPSMYLTEACVVRIIDSISGKDISGSPLSIDAVAILPPAETSDVGVLSNAVDSLTERTTNVATLQSNAAIIMNWLQRTVDRATALGNLEALRFERLNTVVAENGGLSGSIGHFYGLLQTLYSQIAIATNPRPKVSIVIPVHNKFELTYNCINSINDALTSVSFEIIIVDDASSDETLLSSLMFQGGCYTVRTPKNLGFVGACNLGASRASGEYLIFLNNDTIVNDGWLDALSETLDRDPQIGIAGSRLLFSDGVLQEAGGIIWRDGSAWNWGRGQDKSHPTYSFMRDADYVSGAALMIRRGLFENLGGFDELYAPAYYEDTDLCFRVRAAGYRVVVQPKSTIIHLEGQSNGTSTASGLKRYQVINAKKFRNRWNKVLERHRLNGQEPIREAERNAQRRALFIDDSTPTPDKDAGSNAALQHMQSLQRLGYKLVFLPADNMANIPQYTDALQALGIECWYAPFAWSVEEYFRRSERNFDVVYIHRRANAQRYLHLVQKYVPGAKVIFNYADIHALREMREAEIANAPQSRMAQLKRELQSELDIANDVYSVIVHSTFEADFIRSNRPDADVHYVPWTVEARAEPALYGDRSGVAFVGGYGHPPNVDAVDWMIAEIWPLIARRKLGHSFRIVGSNMPDRFQDFRGPDVDPVGYVGDLDGLLDSTAVTVAPLRYGAGLKGKVLSSLARGVPCVMTQIAAEGLELPSEIHHLVRDTPADFASEVTSLLTDEKKWMRTSEICVSFVRERFSQDVIDRLIKEAIKGRAAKDTRQV